jgi:hypothetical protein
MKLPVPKPKQYAFALGLTAFDVKDKDLGRDTSF